jgi:hypothetical protein
MAKQTYNDSPYQSFPANVPADLVGKEGYAVELVPGTNNIQLYTATAGRPLLGFLFERLEGDTNWNVRIAGKGGTVRCVAGDGSIGQAPAYVKAQAGGTMIAAASGNLAHGIKISPAVADAAGDVMEIQDVFITVP